MNERANQPGYPVMTQSYPARDGDYTKHETIGGLTIREHFAGLAMQGMLASDLVMRLSDDVVTANPDTTRGKWIAEQAIGFADALIAALNQGEGK